MSRVFAVVLLVVLAAAGCADAPVVAPPPVPDAAFVGAMVPHHEQALELTALVGGRGASPGLEAIALRIDRDQVEEIGQLRGLALARGLAPASGHAMEGMVPPGTLSTLSTLRGPAFERLWLDTMIRHHEGALVMARDYLSTGRDDTLRRYCEVLVGSQTDEITTMRRLGTSIAGP